ncbi:unnamed protein product [Thlaspi arvense]|uniref:PUM-HD domain-containing protein n=1 Tax=Thlaspi arvense TaxID=13288 RepID=A0AAU9SV39_THLAR|nr:unnamed protein product [Thlaspi arvense]
MVLWTRVVQKLIETINMVKSALKPGLLYLVRDFKGVHFAIEAATRLCAKIATHNHGCYVLKQCVEYSAGEQREKLVDEISRYFLHLAQDPFGNYLVQFIIKQKLGGINIISEFIGGYVKLATQKFSSHVVEKCLIYYPESRSQIVRELVSVENFEHLLQNPFANYVIQSALSNTKGYIRKSLVDKLQRCEHVRMNPHCRKIFFKSHILKM